MVSLLRAKGTTPGGGGMADARQPVEISVHYGGRLYVRRLRGGVITLAEAAALLACTTRTVWNLIGRGELHARRRRGRVFLLLSEVQGCARTRGRR